MSLSKVSKIYMHFLTYTPIPTKVNLDSVYHKGILIQVSVKAVTAATLSYLANFITTKFITKSPMDQKRALKFVAYYLILTPIAQ